MANLLDEEFARRDAPQSAPAPSSGMSTSAYRAATLAQRAEGAAQRGSLAERKFQYDMQKDAAAADSMAAKAEERAGFAERKLGLTEAALANADIRTQIAMESALLDARKADRDEEAKLEVLKQANGFLRDARGMRATADEFDTQLDNMRVGYPDAIKHPAVKEWFDSNVKSRQEFLATKPLDQRLKEAEAMSAAQARGTASTKVESIPEAAATLYSKTKGELAAVISTGEPKQEKDKITAKQKETEARTILRDLERRHPGLVSSAPAAPAAAPVSQFKEGEIRVHPTDGKTYKRDADGKWHPQS